MKTIDTNESFKTAAEKAYDIISKGILNGELKPGDKLSRRKMADFTGVSVIPVIEALKRLEEDGLVESKPQWGSYVTVPTMENIKEMYVLREAIECQIARILCQKINQEQEEELRQIAHQLDNTEYTKDNAEYISEKHYEFHSKMAKFTGYKSLVTTLHRVNLFWMLCSAVSTRRRKSPLPEDWHMRLVDVIAFGDADKAESMMRIHVYDSLKAYEDKGEDDRIIY